MPRVYERKFDWDEARRLREAGLSYAQIARRLGVTTTSVQRVLRPELYEKMRVRLAAWQRSGVCPDCGAQTSRRPNRTSARCRRCHSIHIATSVRPDSLRCYHCQVWKPDDQFPSDKTNPHRRYRHGQCRDCQTAAKRDYRRRNPGRG